MRIISGINKGKKLYAPEGMSVRPTSDKIKEALFNIIGPITDDARVLDLFAGSGNVGIEFLARGARQCIFVDSSNKSLGFVKKNLELCSFTDRARTVLGDYEKTIRNLASGGEKFDYIFADPPYNLNCGTNIARLVFEYNILNPGGLLIIETDKSETVMEDMEDMFKYKEKIYGRTRISILKCSEE